MNNSIAKEVPIISIVKVCSKEVKSFYNFSVNEDESYCSNNIIVHNCKSYFVPLLSEPKKIDGLKFENLTKAARKQYVMF